MPVPYNLQFDLAILSKNQDDALQILEQILPYFQPSFNVSVTLVAEMNETKDLPIILNNINYEDDYEDDMMRRRSIIYTLDFTLKTYMYGPVSNAEIIRKATVFETLGDFQEHKRAVRYDATPKALTDQDGDSDVDNNDSLLLTPDDDFGFNEGITLL